MLIAHYYYIIVLRESISFTALFLDKRVKILFINLFLVQILIGIQWLSTENTLYRELDSSGYEGSALVDRGGGRDLQLELERAS